MPAPAVEAHVTELLARMRDGKLAAGDLDNVVMFGPGLWSSWQLAGLDSNEGIPAMAMARMGDRQIVAHGRVIRFDALAPFMANKPVTTTAAYFADGDIGPANALERQLYYMGISWEIKGEPLTVARKGGEVLVVAISDDGTLLQLELLGPWYRLASGVASEIEEYQPKDALTPE